MDMQELELAEGFPSCTHRGILKYEESNWATFARQIKSIGSVPQRADEYLTWIGRWDVCETTTHNGVRLRCTPCAFPCMCFLLSFRRINN